MIFVYILAVFGLLVLFGTFFGVLFYGRKAVKLAEEFLNAATKALSTPPSTKWNPPHVHTYGEGYNPDPLLEDEPDTTSNQKDI